MGLSFKNDGIKIGSGMGNYTGLRNRNYTTLTIRAHQTLSFNNQSDYSGVFFDNSKASLKTSNPQNPYAGNIYGIGIKTSQKRKPFVKDVKLPLINIDFSPKKPQRPKVPSTGLGGLLTFAQPTELPTVTSQCDAPQQVEAQASAIALEAEKQKEPVLMASKGFEEGIGGLLLMREKSTITDAVYKKLTYIG